jgi:hypothetical protein
VTLRLSGPVCAIDEFERSKNKDALTLAKPAVVNSFMLYPKFFYLFFYKKPIENSMGRYKNTCQVKLRDYPKERFSGRNCGNLDSIKIYQAHWQGIP